MLRKQTRVLTALMLALVLLLMTPLAVLADDGVPEPDMQDLPPADDIVPDAAVPETVDPFPGSDAASYTTDPDPVGNAAADEVVPDTSDPDTPDPSAVDNAVPDAPDSDPIDAAAADEVVPDTSDPDAPDLPVVDNTVPDTPDPDPVGTAVADEVVSDTPDPDPVEIAAADEVVPDTPDSDPDEIAAADEVVPDTPDPDPAEIAAGTDSVSDTPDPNTHNISVEDGVVTVYDNENQTWVENEALTETPVLEGDCKPAEPGIYEDTQDIYPALFVSSLAPEDGKDAEDSSFTVNGSVALEIKRDGVATAVNVEAFERESTVAVNGDVSSAVILESNGGAEYPLATSFGVVSRALPGGSVSVTVDGDVTATGIASEGNNDIPAAIITKEPLEGYGRACAVYADAAGNGAVTEVHVTGDATAASEGKEDEYIDETHTSAVTAVCELSGSVSVQVDGKAAAVSQEHSYAPQAVFAESDTDGALSVTIGKGADGQIKAIAENGGSTAVRIEEGGVTAVIVDPAEDTSLAAVDLENRKDTEGAGTLEVSIIGDVTASNAAENIGIRIRNDEGGKTDVIVDGTVAASDAAVVLVTPETQIGEGVTLTVWELTPNQDGTVVVSADKESKKLIENEQAEKAVQYIIRVQTGQEGIISTTGTEQFKSYNVAHEGDTVTMKLNIPEGFMVSDAYGDVGQNTALTKDAEGNYFLTVPRGGAVELSVSLIPISIPAGVNASPDSSSRNNGTMKNTSVNRTLMSLSDAAGKARLTFRNDGTYFVRFPDGHTETGTFTAEGTSLILIGSHGTKMTIGPDGALSYPSSQDPDLTLEFRFDEAKLKKLIANHI